MCGIAGISGLLRGTRETDLEHSVGKMLQPITHRGPDDSGIWTDDEASIGLGHVRLSILDLSPHGHQPMCSRDGRWVLIYNGEIYNYAELRARLDGMSLRGHSDTEVVLEHIAKFGLFATLERANGMFALAIWDRKLRQLTLARDRFGEKPLYYGWIGNQFVFASELAAVMAIDRNRELEIDRDALALFLAHSAVPSPKSIFKTIAKVPPGTVVEAPLQECGSFGTAVSYWSAVETALDARAETRAPHDELELLNELDALVSDAVHARMMSDVPLGAFLSGGIDSSLIVAMMAKHSNTQVQTFSIGFDDEAFDESGYATGVANHIGTDHTNLIVSEDDLLSVVPKLPSIYSEPFADSSQIPTFLVSELARSKVTVALSGDAGDELFGGYDRYTALASFDRRIERIPDPIARTVGAALLRVSPERYERMERLLPKKLRQKLPPQVGAKVHKGADALLTQGAHTYGAMMTHWSLTDSPVIGASPELSLPFRRNSWPQTDTSFSAAMLVDTITYLPDDILTKVDRAAMAVSLETRVPFLDPALYRFAWGLPHESRSDGTDGKVLLRKLLGRYVPAPLVDRPKKGFGVPLAEWLRGPLRDWAEDLLGASSFDRDGLFDTQQVRMAWEAHLNHRGHNSYKLWDVLMFQAWRTQWM